MLLAGGRLGFRLILVGCWGFPRNWVRFHGRWLDFGLFWALGFGLFWAPFRRIFIQFHAFFLFSTRGARFRKTLQFLVQTVLAFSSLPLPTRTENCSRGGLGTVFELFTAHAVFLSREFAAGI